MDVLLVFSDCFFGKSFYCIACTHKVSRPYENASVWPVRFFVLSVYHSGCNRGACVRALVQLQRIFIAETLAAVTAAKRFLTCVDSQVFAQGIFSCKAFTTITALKRLLTRVAALVHFEMALLAKAYIAVFAFIGSFIVVDATLVCVQSTFL